MSEASNQVHFTKENYIRTNNLYIITKLQSGRDRIQDQDPVHTVDTVLTAYILELKKKKKKENMFIKVEPLQ